MPPKAADAETSSR